MKFFIYSRKSVFTGKGDSIENQVEMCRGYISDKFPDEENIITIYEDEGFSAKNTARPQFQKMLRDLRSCRPDFIVCYRLDRISRSVSDFSALIEELSRRNIAFICIKEEFDTSKPMGKAMMYIASVFAQLERETIAERVRDNMLMLSRSGHWLGGTTPTGFDSERAEECENGRVRSFCRLTENRGELRTVELIFSKYFELRSISAVGKYLSSKGILSRSGKPYTLTGIKEILRNPVYCRADTAAYDYFTAADFDVCFERSDCTDRCGLISYNKRGKDKKSGSGIIAIGRHSGLISGERWADIQRIILENTPDGIRPSKCFNDYSLLSGLIYCQKCGGRMFAKRRSGGFDYICSSKLRGGKALCDIGNINGICADSAVCDSLSGRVIWNGGLIPLLQRLKKSLCERADDELDLIGREIKCRSEEADGLLRALSHNPEALLVGRINARFAELEHELKELEAKQSELILNRAAQSDNVKILSEELSSPQKYFSSLTVTEKRSLIRLLVRKAIWDGEQLCVCLDGADLDIASAADSRLL